jgi:MarR family transcriptional regulator, lower aerobic nicotinate degradation pathway regulator
MGPGEEGRESGADGIPWTLTHRTGFLISTLGRFSREATERALEPLGIKPHHYGMLVVLAEKGPASQQAVGEMFGIDKSSMVVFVDQLEGLGLVERRRNPENRRAYRLTLTDAGREALSEAEPLVEEVEEALLSPLGDADRERLHGLLLNLLPGPGGRGDG